MPATLSKSTTPRERKRRAHAKSRKGCNNCKLRRVKCDETRPGCTKCKTYGVSCDFGESKDSLDAATHGSFQVNLTSVIEDSVVFDGRNESPNWIQIDSPRSEVYGKAAKSLEFTTTSSVVSSLGNPWSPVSSNANMTAMISGSLESVALSQYVRLETEAAPLSPGWSWEFTEVDFEILTRFQSRTSLTIGDQRMAPEYRDVVCQLAFQHPFLMHMLLGLTLMHDSDLSLRHSPALSAKQQHMSLFHWDLATSLFYRIMAYPLTPAYRDAIWATGVHLGASSFWFVESNDPNAVWPLKPSEPSDLSWIKFGEGKRHLWRIADPMREDSLFHNVLKHRPRSPAPQWVNGEDTEFIPEIFQTLFDIHESSTKENNPYLVAVVILSRIRNMHLTHANVLHFLYFTTFITPEFIELLEHKDTRAVFLLGWWFRILEDGDLWWMTRRARIQGKAVRMWLRGRNRELAHLLDELARERVLCASETPTMQIDGPCDGDKNGFDVNWALDSRGKIPVEK
ncbi:hypothetical protein ACJQWK_06816 [Exserohilum turcicum]|uniref:Zn(2)-C6 fungal-type domain-containing protein n=1 Tax=Exserohilum turcicum (strain 28A) TaxID=671987 RepID=R0IIU2_EXST2|nr:uncharacterized protein SETTUDRAFT_163792 [Exserohilum turcica Et28A]EOA85065.1 hypothetical protein SETTUDRAFT_163792 [Exserohilum turcica Et28A]